MWPPTGLIPWFSKTEGNTYATLLHHPFLFKGKPTQCSRGRKKDFWRRCQGGLRKSQHTKYPSQSLISRITLFAICLSFSSPPLHPCRFIRPLFSVRLLLFCPSLFLSLCLKLGKLLPIWTIIISWKILMLLLKNPLPCIQKNSNWEW